MPPRKTRDVSLTPRLEAFIDGRVATSRYRSVSEVVRAGLRLLEQAETPRHEEPRYEEHALPPRPADAAPRGR